LPFRASEVIFDSEVYFVSEVSPDGEAANLTSLLCQQKLHCGCNFTLNFSSKLHKNNRHPLILLEDTELKLNIKENKK